MMEGVVSPCLLYFFIAFSIAELIVIFILYRKNRQETVTEEDVISLVNEGHEDGNILTSEAAMIANIFEFSDTDVKDIMTHRKNIVSLDGNMKLSDAICLINSNHFSRYPVYLDDPDNIIGIFHIKDALNYFNKDCSMLLKDLTDYLTPVEFVPETHGINTLFAKMQSKKTHMVIVVDEYGQVSGLLSMEDILEEIVGNIEDEHDDEEVLIEKKNEDCFVMDGTTSLSDAEEIIGIKLSSDFETLNGYLISLLGKIPEDGSSFTLEDENFTYEVKNVSGKVIDEVVLKRKTL